MEEREILDNDFLVIEDETPDYVEIMSANSKEMLNLVKITLRRSDIPFFVKNEMMLQIEPFLASTSVIDAVPVMVRQQDAERATQLLEDNVQNIKGTGEMTEPISDFTNSIVDKIPFLKDLRSELQMIIIFGTIAILFAFTSFFILNTLGLLAY